LPTSSVTSRPLPRTYGHWSPAARRSRRRPIPRLLPNDRDGTYLTTTMPVTQPQHFRRLSGNSACDSYKGIAASIPARSATMYRHHFRLLGAMSLLGATLAMQVSPSSATEPYDPWPGLVQDVFNNRPMSDGSDVIGIEMPYRAEDAAI